MNNEYGRLFNRLKDPTDNRDRQNRKKEKGKQRNWAMSNKDD